MRLLFLIRGPDGWVTIFCDGSKGENTRQILRTDYLQLVDNPKELRLGVQVI